MGIRVRKESPPPSPKHVVGSKKPQSFSRAQHYLKRRQLFEFSDQPWLPAIFREFFNSSMRYAHEIYRPYERGASLIAAWAQRSQATSLLDLGSAGGGHIERLIADADTCNMALPRIMLSDLFPMPDTWKRLTARYGSALGYSSEPISILNVPNIAPRHWVIFTSFHHFPPCYAAEFLRHFAHQADGLCIAELYPSRKVRWMVLTILSLPLAVLIPLYSRRSLITKLQLFLLLPIAILMYAWDALVSVLRAYAPEEIIDMLPTEIQDQFTVEFHETWWGSAPMKSTFMFITRKAVLAPGV